MLRGKPTDSNREMGYEYGYKQQTATGKLTEQPPMAVKSNERGGNDAPIELAS
jgi:hypothetical protein